jgi:glycosyltransferase involved in cell wall biosynthesis
MAARPLRWAWRRSDHPRIETWTGRIDVVHGTNFVVPPARRAAQVVTVHDLTPMRYPELAERATLAYDGLIRRALERGAWVHTPSAFVAAEVVEHFACDPARVVAVHEGVPSPAPVDEGRGSPAGGHPYILTVGTVEPRKDHPGLVRAFDTLADGDADVRLVIAGPDGWGADALRAALDGARHRDRVLRVGYVADDERARLVHGAAAFVFPSLYEGFGLPPLEAMAAGVPVVATSAGALPEVLGDAALLVPSGDEGALATALATALDDTSERDRLVRAGRARAARYSWDACAAGIVDLYRRAVAA